MARAGGGRADAFVEERIIGLWADRSPRAADRYLDKARQPSVAIREKFYVPRMHPCEIRGRRPTQSLTTA
jgi:hypothetical protein